jgi:PAT family beta-lactamase induction signal transducer AmpG
MKLPDLLATRRGRFSAFFFLYVTEGLPLGFTATAVATQMRRQGLGPSEIGVFVGTLYLPWAWKWVMGPVVDLFYSDTLGRRRGWIVGMQILMSATLLLCMPIDFTAELRLFTLLIMVVNIFGATQDVAIDALACGVLHEDERGLANGLMFAGAYIGQALGGAGVLFLASLVGFNATFFCVAAAILSVTIFVALGMREPVAAPRQERQGRGLGAAWAEIRGYCIAAVKAFVGSRAALVGAVVAILPAGAYSLSLALQSNLAVELGLSDRKIALLALLSTVISAVGCVAGGYLSDRFGRKRMLAIYLVGTTIPVAALGWVMDRHGWIMPIDPRLPDRPVPADVIIVAFWVGKLGKNCRFCLFFGVPAGVCDGRPPESQLGTLTNGRQEIRM